MSAPIARGSSDFGGRNGVFSIKLFLSWCLRPRCWGRERHRALAPRGGFAMRRAFLGAVIGLGFCAFGPLAAENPGKGTTKSGVPLEKADNSVDRSLTGHVEKVDAKD